MEFKLSDQQISDIEELTGLEFEEDEHYEGGAYTFTDWCGTEIVVESKDWIAKWKFPIPGTDIDGVEVEMPDFIYNGIMKIINN